MRTASITGHRDMNVLRGYLRGLNQRELARQAIPETRSRTVIDI
jgi:hypothetical protein